MRMPLISTALCLLMLPATVNAEDVFDRLKAEPVTMLDFGLKRLRSSTLQAARSLRHTAAPSTQASVVFDPTKREIRIEFFISSNAEAASDATCQTKRKAAIRETFLIGATAYGISISDTQRVIRRLGLMFTREPAETKDTVQAMGERLAQSTYLKVTLKSDKGEMAISCGGYLDEKRDQ